MASGFQENGNGNMLHRPLVFGASVRAVVVSRPHLRSVADDFGRYVQAGDPDRTYPWGKWWWEEAVPAPQANASVFALGPYAAESAERLVKMTLAS